MTKLHRFALDRPAVLWYHAPMALKSKKVMAAVLTAVVAVAAAYGYSDVVTSVKDVVCE